MAKLQNKIKLHFKFPTRYNDQTSIPDKKFVDVRNYFVDLYGGLTIDSPSSGFWKDDGLVYQDETLEYSVFIPKKKFKQIDILCYYYNVVSN